MYELNADTGVAVAVGLSEGSAPPSGKVYLWRSYPALDLSQYLAQFVVTICPAWYPLGK